MLNEAVRIEKGELDETDTFTTTMDLNLDAYIPDSYIPNEYQKLDIYKRIAGIESEEEMDDMLEELIDRFGDIPKKVQQLLQIANLKALAHSADVTAVEQKQGVLKITMYEKAKADPQKIPALIASYHGKLVFKAENPSYFLYQRTGGNRKERSEDVLEVVKMLLNDIKCLLDT
jgi:transcription-repair coupling factor (superfamily II helicase)